MLTAVLVNVNRDPNKGEPAKPNDFFYFKPDDGTEARISASTADAFFSLVGDSKLPAWVGGIAPIDRLRTARAGGRPTYPRAWVGGRVVLINPVIVDGKVTAPLAIIDETRVDCPTHIRDVDGDFSVCINIPQGLQRYVVDAEFEMSRVSGCNSAKSPNRLQSHSVVQSGTRSR